MFSKSRLFPVVLLFIFSLTLALAGCSPGNSDERRPSVINQSKEEEGHILIFSKTEGYRHASIPDGIATMSELAGEMNMGVTATEDAGYFTGDSLERFQAVVFLNTTGDVLNESQQQALVHFIEQGKGFMGIHSATDTEYGWPWYGQMIGAYFDGHPQIQQADLEVLVPTHPATSHLPDIWTRTDEWYNFRDIQGSIKPLINIDESSYQGGTNGTYHPIAWTHDFEGARIFYTAGGHTAGSYSEPLFVDHLSGGLAYVLGREEE